MNYIDEIFRRADIQCISGFLLYGTDSKIETGSYAERIEVADKKWIKTVREEYPDEQDFDKISQLISSYANTVENIYMEIGLQIGAILTAQVCNHIKNQ